jgi:hypothetical protein
MLSCRDFLCHSSIFMIVITPEGLIYTVQSSSSGPVATKRLTSTLNDIIINVIIGYHY